MMRPSHMLVALCLLQACIPGLSTTPPEDCTNGVDDDGDGLPDCEDADCFGLRTCDELLCDDTLDDDNDGLVDCADDDCWGLLSCRAQREVLPAQVDVRRHVYGNGSACGSVAPPASFTGFVSFSGYHNTTVVIENFQTRITDQVTGEVCTWTASELRGRWVATDSGMSNYPPTLAGLTAQGCTQPSSWAVPQFVRPAERLPWGAPRFTLSSVESLYNSYGPSRPWLTLDLVQTHQASTRTPGGTFAFDGDGCRSFFQSSSTSWSGTVVP